MNHEISLAVWDLPSPIVIGRRAALKVGISCSSGCALAGTSIDIHDETGVSIGSGRVGSAPWPGTTALYWAELEIAAPEAEGDHDWRIHAIVLDELHGEVISAARIVACRPPEHRVTFEVTQQGSGDPLGGVELRVGAFRAATDAAGVACVDVPRATYEIGTWKIGYKVLSKTIDVASDATIRLQLIAVPEPEQPYWM